MHHIYTTPAIIVKSSALGEANKIYFLLTEDLGFIRATAQGVRFSKSKLKGHLRDFSLINVSLVKGKEFWRITNAETESRLSLKDDLGKISVIKNIFSLILRLVHGEEKNENLFYAVRNLHDFLFSNDEKHLKNAEAITVLRVLHHLGYLRKNAETEKFLDLQLSPDILELFEGVKKGAIKEINEALKETHL